MALVVPTGRGQWGVSWIEKGPLYPRLQSNVVMVTPDQEVALVKSLPFDRVKNGETYWQRLSDSRGRPLWSLTVAVKTQTTNTPGNPTVSPLPEGTDYQSVQVGTGNRAFVVGFFGSNPLVTATEDYIGSTSSAFVIDSRGYAATRSNKTMIGALMRDDAVGGPVTKEILQARSSAGALRYKTSAGNQVFSAFEQVDRSNLFVVMSTPDSVISTSTERHLEKRQLQPEDLRFSSDCFWFSLGAQSCFHSLAARRRLRRRVTRANCGRFVSMTSTSRRLRLLRLQARCFQVLRTSSESRDDHRGHAPTY